MMKRKEEDVKLVTLTLKEIETRVLQNSDRFKDTIEQVTSNIQSKNLKKGRVRPKHPVEAKILNQFKK